MVEIVRIHSGMPDTLAPEIVGAKAANISHMAKLGIPVPPAFVLPIQLCADIIKGDSAADLDLKSGLAEGIEFLEEQTGLKFGDGRRPLLVSVRSGAARSMPGMLDTVLDVGCTMAAAHGLIRMTGNPRFAWDCRRRFIESYGEIVLGLDASIFKRVCDEMLRTERANDERDLDSEALERMVDDFERVLEEDDIEIPDSPEKQLRNAARAVYRSWVSERAVTYRRLSGLDALAGTAVTVQAMVFGNRNLSSGAGVAFSRNPSNGDPEPVVEVLIDAQGEDIVAGRQTPDDEKAVENLNSAVARQIRETLSQLERHFADVQDIEFTIDDGKLWLLQTRAAKRTPLAECKFAVDLVHEGLVSKSVALKRLASLNFDQLGASKFDGDDVAVTRGIGASTGVAVGRVAFDSLNAERISRGGESVILVRPDISTSDISGFSVAAGILTAAGGRTAHAALVARQLGKACVVGCNALAIEPGQPRARLAEAIISEGDWISIDGNSGDVFLGRRPIVIVRPEEELREIESWRGFIAAE